MLHLPRVKTDLAKNPFYSKGSVIFHKLNFYCFKILLICTVAVYSPYLMINLTFPRVYLK